MFGRLKFYLRSWDAFAETYRARKYGRWEIPRTCRGRDRLRATNLNVGKSHCSHTVRNNRPRNPGDGERGSAKFRSPRRDAHKKEPRDTLSTRVRERVSEDQQPGSRRVLVAWWIFISPRVKSERRRGKHRVNYKVNGREIRLSCLLLSRSDVTENRHGNQTRAHGLTTSVTWSKLPAGCWYG